MPDRHKQMLDLIMAAHPQFLPFNLAEIAEILEMYTLRIGTGDRLETLYQKFRRGNTFAPEL